MNLDIEHGERNLELLQRSAELCGLITHKLSEHNSMHLTHQEQILEFYKGICSHKEDCIRKCAVYNLPAMHLHFKSVQHEQDLNFAEIYK